MAIWRYFAANTGIYAYRWETEKYSVSSSSAKKIVYTYDSGVGGGFESDRLPWKIELKLKGAGSFKPDAGPNAGKSIFNDGEIVQISMFDKSGKPQITVTGFEVPLVAYQGWLTEDGDFGKIFTLLEWEDSKFLGNNNGPKAKWDDYTRTDEIFTGAGKDVVNAKGGNDYITDHGGSDTYNGGAGWDQLSYDHWFWDPWGIGSGITADLQKKKIVGPDGNVDKVKNIESLRGTFHDDVMRGDKGDNEFQGLAGNDLIDGRKGVDRVSYRNDDNQGGYSGIVADLKKGKVQDGYGNTDKIKNIEEVQGTDVRDVFKDNKADNYFDGRAGNDQFFFSTGNDWARGREGADVFVYQGKNFGKDGIGDFNAAEGDHIRIMAANKFSDLKISSADGGHDTIVTLKGTSSEVYLEDVSSVSAGDFLF